MAQSRQTSDHGPRFTVAEVNLFSGKQQMLRPVPGTLRGAIATRGFSDPPGTGLPKTHGGEKAQDACGFPATSSFEPSLVWLHARLLSSYDLYLHLNTFLL